jgi:hypothetical protein
MLTIKMKVGVMRDSNPPRRNRNAAIPAKFCAPAAAIRMPPQTLTVSRRKWQPCHSHSQQWRAR